MQSVDELVDVLRTNGGRITPQRIAVLEAISGDESHPSVDAIFARITKSQPALSLKTVYQIVKELDQLGAISLIDVGTGQIRVDTFVEEEHDHFLCTSCSSVYDVKRTRKEKKQKQLNDYGEVKSTEIIYKGICKNCK